MRSTLIQRLFVAPAEWRAPRIEVFDPARSIWSALEHLLFMNREQLSAAGLEPMLTTTELAAYLGVNAQAIYDLRNHGRGPAGVRVGREIRFTVSDIKVWLHGIHESDPVPAMSEKTR